MNIWSERYRPFDDCPPEALPEVTLNASSLFSKWGFRDGDVLWEWIESVDATDYNIFQHFRNIRGNKDLTLAQTKTWSPDHHATLCDLVHEHLLPLIPGEFTTYITDSHNPIRIDTWRGRKFNYHAEDMPSGIPDIAITLPGTTILSALTATTVAARDDNQ